MKKFIIAAVCLAMCAGNARAFDNEPEQGFTFMGIFGMNVTSLQNHDYGAKAGAMLGARADYVLPHAHGTYITGGFDWTMKGGKGDFWKPIKVDGQNYDATGKYSLHYFEVPIRVGFRYNLNDELGFFGEFGPYFSIGFAGKHRVDTGEDGSKFSDAESEYEFKAFKNKTDTEKPTFQRWDAGLGFRIGAEYNQHYNLMLGCDWGLTDIYRNNFRDEWKDAPEHANEKLSKVHNFNFSITVGYRF